jgi:maltose alpha-D-glucosyltransferase/alpha-amylase
MSERRLKYCPLRDVGGMIWSLGSAIQTSLLHNPSLRPEDLQFLEPWAEIWLAYMESIFMTAYMRTVHDAPFIPDSKQDIMVLLNSFIIERAMNNLRVGLMTGPDNCLPAIRAIRVFLKKYHDFFKEQK